MLGSAGLGRQPCRYAANSFTLLCNEARLLIPAAVSEPLLAQVRERA